MPSHFFVFWTLWRPVFTCAGEAAWLGLHLEVTEWGWKKLKMVKAIKAFLKGRSHKLMAQQYVKGSFCVFWDKLASVQVVRHGLGCGISWGHLSLHGSWGCSALSCPQHLMLTMPRSCGPAAISSWALCWALSRGRLEPWSCLALALLEPAHAACGGRRPILSPSDLMGCFSLAEGVLLFRSLFYR